MTETHHSPSPRNTGTTGTVVSLFRARPQMKLTGLHQLTDYWTELCEGGQVPLRAEIDPRRIDAVLAETFILQRIAPGLARFRVAGSHLADLMGMDVRGMPLSALIVPARRDAFADALNAVFTTPARLHLRLHSPGGLGRRGLTGRMVILPLRCDKGTISRAIGCLVTDGPPGRAPRRFDISRSRIVPVQGGALAAASAPPPRPTEADGHPHLRLVKSD